MPDILKDIQKELPKVISSATFEGANIVLYTDDMDFFKDNNGLIKELVNKFKKRIELRADSKLLKSHEETEKTIKEAIPKDAGLTEILFDPQRSIVVIEAKRPGLVIGKSGLLLKEIKDKTFWIPQVQRSPAIKSKITENIRAVLYQNNNVRKKFLNSVGKKIYKEWNPEKIEGWIRITFLGGGRQVGRSCILLQTQNSKILLDCGVDVASKGKDKFPYLDVSEFKINELDAIVVSHAHLDHCLPPQSLVLTEKGYKPINNIEIGEHLISMDWKTGKYVLSKCTEKTRTTGHKKTLTITTPYSKIESSPNHKFFTFGNMELKELRADNLKKDMLLPSNLLNKSKIEEKIILLNTKAEYDKRRKDNVILPEVLNPKLAEFIGYFAGDGHKSSDFSLRLTDSSLQILNHHKETIEDLFNLKCKIRHHSDKAKNAFILEINNVKIVRFLERNFPEIFYKAKKATIPAKIINADSENQKAFIRGFADAEGSVTNIIKICSFSKKMLEGLQHLFSLQEIPSNIKRDNTICLNTNFSINEYSKKIGFSLDYKQEKLETLSKNRVFKKQDLMPVTSEDLRKILEQAGMFGRIHKSPILSKLLPMCLLDLFRRKKGYATRETVLKLINFLIKRVEILKTNKSKTNLYALRQLLSITRQQASLETGIKIHQIQQIEENRILSQEYLNLFSLFLKEKLLAFIINTQKNIHILKNLLSMNVIWEKISRIEEKDNPHEYLVDIETEYGNFISGNIVVHNSGLIPYLFKMGYRGPVYMSVDYAEPILIKENGITKKVKIGEYIDNQIKKAENIEKLPFYEYNAVSPNKEIEAVAFSNSDYKLGFKKIKKLIRHKICEGDNLYKIKTKTNRAITVTGSHSVFILKDGEVKEAKVNEIKEGDYLVVPHKLPSTNTEKINIPEILNEFNCEGDFIKVKQGHKIPKEIKITEELMRILGYFAAEGNFDKRSLQFSFGLKDINYVKQLEEDTEKVFGIKSRVNLSKGNVLRVCIHSKIIRELFFRLFFKDHTRAISKRVPEIVFNADNKLKLQFLRAYLNGDGTINYHNKTAVAMSVSKELISDLTYICSQIGFNYHTYEGYMSKDAKTKNKVYQLIINLKDLFDENKICIAKSNLIPLKETLFEDEWFYHRLKTKMHVTKERLISLLNSNLIKYKDSAQIRPALSKLANSDLSFLPIIKIEKVNPTNGYVYDVSVEGDQNFVAGETPICLHNTTPTRDISALLALDFIGVAYKQAAPPLFSSTDIKEMVKHTICLSYNEVTDIAPDVRITLYNAGHTLGSSLVHINIGNGAHNLLYTGDMKFIRTQSLDRAIGNFPRLETMIVESTYGSRNDVLPSRKEGEEELIKNIKETIEKKGKVLIPELGVGRAQETMLILEQAMKENRLPKIPIYIDGMIWDINGIHTAYPDFLNSNVRSEIFQDNNPFVSEIFKRVGSPSERKKVIEGGPCVVLATSGMLVGGASVEYFRHFAPNKNNKICFVCYQGVGSLGRQVQEGLKQVQMNVEGKEETIEIKIEITTINSFTAHAGRNELLEYVNRCQPRPNRIIVNHGEQSKCLDLASSIYKLHHIETNVPRNLETIRLR